MTKAWLAAGDRTEQVDMAHLERRRALAEHGAGGLVRSDAGASWELLSYGGEGHFRVLAC